MRVRFGGRRRWSVDGEPTRLVLNGWQTVVFWIAYAPLAARGPPLGVLTVHYYRRRTAAAPVRMSPGAAR
ncbi:hypothetical protein K3N28_18675 [Glycomyces sp. TRM65418]|uniref:hypothetical protein n=1 Tax=Glycomyces sp. TRM65418 TaxID=2867006 RepID=UPI001CE59ACD|nr:hypothetical protein [Glycomyces sp. TRM65418]MCC3765088.1 hypothetical protein [Glycomyces sp. TRM65418]QZD54717.1 hypothetical protein K3N28_18585 [Glycomyces sp. TRM65418]